MSVADCGVMTVLASSAGLWDEADELAGETLIFAALCGGAVLAQLATTHAVENAPAQRPRPRANSDKRRECLPSLSRSANNPTQPGNLRPGNSKHAERSQASESSHCFSGISPEITHFHRGL